MWIDWARNAVKTTRAEDHKDSADIFDIARPMLTDWGKELIQNEIVDSFFSVPLTTVPANLGSANGQRVNGISFDAGAGARQQHLGHQQRRSRAVRCDDIELQRDVCHGVAECGQHHRQADGGVTAIDETSGNAGGAAHPSDPEQRWL